MARIVGKKTFCMLMALDVWNKLDPLEFMLYKRKTLSTPKLVTRDRFFGSEIQSAYLLILSETLQQTEDAKL